MNEGEEIRFIDLFSGIGGFRLGLERANSGVGAKLTAREGGHKDQKGLSADSGSKDGYGRREHTDDSRFREGLERANNRMEKDRVETGTSPRSCSKSKTFGTSKEERAGYFRCVWSCDNNKHANQVYTKHFGEANHYSGDVRGVDPRGIPDFDLLCAGFPCQSFSVAGPRTGFQDTRGTLFYEISRIAEAKRPQMLLLENVKGLLSNDRGQTFQTILQELGRIGYWAEWQTFNSKHHRVPQNRERVFIIGHLRNGCPRPIFPIGETDKVAEEDGKGRPSVQPEVSTAIDGSYYKGVDRHGQRTVIGVARPAGDWFSQRAVHSPRGMSPTLRCNHNDPAPRIAVSFTNPHNPDEERKVNLGDVSRAVKPPYGNQQPLILRWQNLKDGVVIDEIAPTLRSSGGTDIRKKPAVIKDLRIRRLTPVECERLQGFPDGWTAHGICKKGDIVWTGKYRTRVEIDEDGLEVTRYRPIMTKAKADGIYPITDTNRYKCLGNAVTVNVIEFLGHKIMDSMGVDILDKKVNGEK